MFFLLFLQIQAADNNITIDDYYINTITLQSNQILKIHGYNSSLFISFQTTTFLSSVQMIIEPNDGSSYIIAAKPAESFFFIQSNVTLSFEDLSRINVSVWNLPLLMCPPSSYHAAHIKSASITFYPFPKISSTCFFFNFPSSISIQGSWSIPDSIKLSIIDNYDNNTHIWSEYYFTSNNSTSEIKFPSFKQTILLKYQGNNSITKSSYFNISLISNSFAGDWNLGTSLQPFFECNEDGNCTSFTQYNFPITIIRSPNLFIPLIIFIFAFLFIVILFFLLWKKDKRDFHLSSLFWTSDGYLNKHKESN